MQHYSPANYFLLQLYNIVNLKCLADMVGSQSVGYQGPATFTETSTRFQKYLSKISRF